MSHIPPRSLAAQPSPLDDAAPQPTAAQRHHRQLLLTPAQMGQADAATIARGVPGIELMRRAGQAVALAVARRWQPCRVAVLCGPGNNGGDGFVAAQWLRARGWPVRVFLLGQLERLRGDAAWAASQWQGQTEEAAAFDPAQCDIVIDALFGAGLCRPLDGLAADLVQQLAASGLPVCAVDVPSGLDGASGQPQGPVAAAALTVSFFRAKPGHWLYPGRALCGELVLADIGIADDVPIQPAPKLWRNVPSLWQGLLPQPAAQGHKYQRGHVLVLGGARLTGAARLCAQAAQRSGAGLVTVLAPQPVWPVYAQALQASMVQPFADAQQLGALLDDVRAQVCVIGPGAGVQALTRQAVLAAAQRGKALVLDADALTAFAQEPQALFQALAANRAATAVLTPHEGEFARLFPELTGSKPERAAQAARLAQAVLVLKGADTVIAAPDGRVLINSNAPPELATGGTGDVLAGMVAAWLAQGAPALAAACAAVWLHAQAAQRALERGGAVGWGRRLTAEDLLHAL
ncbi:NAD(P)H-hydrate dehydratase [Vandammella animalimorsus]|uniref:NAD(P)H-hydrate dehydratase n=1 Tax=Vandammella animalimorsus TaxID=2029117 RepID=UPI0031BB127F